MKSLVACFLLAALLACTTFASTVPPEYEIRKTPGTGIWSADNPYQGLGLAWVGDSIRISPLAPEGSWEISLSLARPGWAGGPTSARSGSAVATGNRVDFLRAAGPTEWWINEPAGVQQWFRVSEAPVGESCPVAIEIALGGDLMPRLAEHDRVLEWRDEGGRVVARYALRQVVAADGRPVSAEMELTQGTGGRPSTVRIVAAASSTDYPISVGLSLGAPKNLDMPPLADSVVARAGSSDVTAASVPSNDSCEGAEIIPPSGPFPYLTAVTADVTDATPTGDPTSTPSCQPDVSRSIWYRFTPAVTALYTISTCEDAPTATTVTDDVIDIYTADSCSGPFTEVSGGCDDDGCGTLDLQAVASRVQLSAGTTYFIVVYQYSAIAPSPGQTAVQLQVTRAFAPANDACSTAAPLTLNTIVEGSSALAAADYSLDGSTTCFPGSGTTNTSTTATGRDTVWSFTPAVTGTYSFRAITTDGLGSGNLVLYTSPTCPPAPATLSCGAGTTVVAANRTVGSSQYLAAEEVWCQNLTGGTPVYVFVDETLPSTKGGAYSLEVQRCVKETEPNNTPDTASAYSCGVEGAIGPGGDVDFFSLGTPPSGSRVFAISDGIAANSADEDMRVTTTADTLEYDDANNSSPWGSLGPNVAGTKLAGTASYLRVSHFSPTMAAEPYRLYAVVQAPGADAYGSSATAETEPNDSIGAANAAGNMFFSGNTSATDLDLFRFCATAGDVIMLNIDGDPTRSPSSPMNPQVYLFDEGGGQLLGFDDAGSTSSTASGAGSLTATTPFSPGEAATWRARYTGTYYAGVQGSGTAGTGDYVYSIAVNCQPGSQQAADLTLTSSDAPDPVVAGSTLTYTLTVTNAGPSIALDAQLIDPLPAGTTFQAITGTGSGGPWICSAPPVGTYGTVRCTSPCFASGGSHTFHLTVKVNPCIGNGTVLANTATVSTKISDPNAANDIASATTTAQDPGTCDDGNACTLGDACSGGSCVGTPKSCNDGNACTADTCDPASGACSSTPIRCDDGNPCTDDTCDTSLGCRHTPNAAPCDDGNVCTTADTCVGGSCVGSSPLRCDDGNPCTDDACDPEAGCVFTGDDANSCSDGNACTVDACLGGVCGCPPEACPAGTASTFTHSTPLPIPDGGTSAVTSTITVSGLDPYLLDVNVQTFLTHAYSGDMEFTLTSPAGTVVTLSSRNGGNGVDVFNGTLFDDQADPGGQIPYASAHIVTNYAYVSNSVATPLVPEEALGAFIGEDPNGEWTLSLRDAEPIDVGTLNGWTLFLTTLPTTPLTMVKAFGNSAPLPIPDTAATVSSSITVSGAGTVLGRLRLTTNLAHPSPGQIEMTLSSPAGRVVTIAKQRGGANADVFASTTWDDKADPGSPIPYTDNPNLVTDHTYEANTLASPLVVEEALSAFNGEDPNGVWTLTLRDVATPAEGTLYGWTIEVGTIRCRPASCPVSCDDANVCTIDTCDPGTGCRHAPGPDIDGDTVCDAADCAPSDAGAFAIPAEVGGLGVSGGSSATIHWLSAAPGAGSGTVHQVLRGVVSQLPVGTGGSETCLAEGLPGTSITDDATPVAGSAFYYLVRGENACGAGTYGRTSRDAERTSTACP